MVSKKALYMREYRKEEKNRIKHLEDSKEYYKINKDKIRLYKRKYREANKEMIKLKKKIYALKNKDLINKWSKESRVRNPEKMKARSIAKSKIKIPKGEKCQTCKIKLAVERHHEDYSKPLEVVFLCKSCHSKLNKRGDW